MKHKQFTIHDFLVYGNPCFNCKQGRDFEFIIHYKNYIKFNNVSISPVIYSNHIEVKLINKYFTKLSLKIDYKTNEFQISSVKNFHKFIENRSIFIRSNCTNCSSYVLSEKLTFNFDTGRVNPFILTTEVFMLDVDNKIDKYIISSDFVSETTYLLFFDSNKTMELPLLPLYKFKTKEELLRKIKIYTTFQ